MKTPIDCVGETCSRCLHLPSCLRIAILTCDGELADYSDVCYKCAAAIASEASMERSDFSVYHERAKAQGKL